MILAIVCALFGGIAGFAAAGFGAAAILVSVFGNRDGGPGMSGFFFFGPVGAIAGALLGAGLALRFGGGSPQWAKGLMIGSGVVFLLGGVLLAVTAAPKSGPSYSHVIEFELEYPLAALSGVEIPSSNAMWGAAGADLNDRPISQFFEKNCGPEVCVLGGSVAAVGPMNNFHIATSIGQGNHKYPLDLPAVIGPTDWSEWRPGDGARVRWRIVRR